MKLRALSIQFAMSLYILFTVMPPYGWGMEAVDHGIYADLLQKYVKNGVVEYAGFKKDEAKLTQYLKILEQTDAEALSRSEQLAFYINAYNANTIKLVLTGYPGIKSIKDLGTILKSPWKKDFILLDGKRVSLDDIEHGIIRPRFQDPRVHFAVNCASRSCPPLLSEPYRGDILDRQLDSAVRAFINNPERNYLKDDTLYVSKIFDWYGGDFKEGVVDFVKKYAEGNLKRALDEKKARIEIGYVDYDWALNGK